jgi:hypothetical protein
MRGMEAAEMRFLGSSSEQTTNVMKIVLLQKDEGNRKLLKYLLRCY